MIFCYTINMNDDLNKIDQEELDRLEDELLEKEAREREEKMIIEGRSIFDLQRIKNKKDEHKADGEEDKKYF